MKSRKLQDALAVEVGLEAKEQGSETQWSCRPADGLHRRRNGRDRRRTIQESYNLAHGVVPTTIVKA
ncbi:MAG: hypothetical protein CO108_08315, partial [Deltaproteobacteria bacterium CG_4_9_14_3_um_filter_63_12]